ncbi:hypothetical protein B0H16DRAFT_1691625 [Mycena metata]|uniref:Uncharacterized protein n=1 Tax=Mycena metata TaxID=1033252 RepID=A0AAD7N7N2_9AGAR|nr:hypothetical protein B0H16DRAFT_1691625 [Mycena metata]
MSSSNPTISCATSATSATSIEEDETRAERRAFLVKTQKHLMDEMMAAGDKVVLKPIPDDTSEQEMFDLKTENILIACAARDPHIDKLAIWQSTLSGEDWELLLPRSAQVEGWDDLVDDLLCCCDV